MRSISRLVKVQRAAMRVRVLIWNRFWGMSIHPTVRVSLSAKLDKTNPGGVHIDAHTFVAFGSTILAHDSTRRLRCDTWIGRNCFIGARSIVMPGIRIGDGCIVAAGAVVTRDVPSGSIVAGNPATVLRDGVDTDEYGILKSADIHERKQSTSGSA